MTDWLTHSTGSEDFGILLLKQLASGASIGATDAGVDADGTFFRGGGGGESHMRYTAVGIVPAGTVLHMANFTGNKLPLFTHVGNGDQVIVYEGGGSCLASTSACSFLCALHVSNYGWDSRSSAQTTSALPPGLVDGETCVTVAVKDTVVYAGSTRGVESALPSAIHSAAVPFCPACPYPSNPISS